MERIKRIRAAERRCVTKSITSLETDLMTKPLPDEKIEATVRLLESHEIKLGELDEAYFSALLDVDATSDDVYNTETDTVEEYSARIALIKVKVGKALKKKVETISDTISEAGSATNPWNHDSMKLPKSELKKYSGKLEDWLDWWAWYENIHENPCINDKQKFFYLSQCMVKDSKAAKLVGRYVQIPSNYEKVIEVMKKRFGNQDLLSLMYVKELIQMVSNKNTERFDLSNHFDSVETKIQHLESLGLTLREMNVFLYPMVVASLPFETLVAWQRSANYEPAEETEEVEDDGSTTSPTTRKTKLDFLREFLAREVELFESRSVLCTKGNDMARRSQRRDTMIDDDVPTAAGLFNGSSSCVFCSKGHASKDCFKAKKTPIEENKQLLLKRGACFQCLVPGYMRQRCGETVKCSRCQGRHFMVVCPKRDEVKPKPNPEATPIEITPATTTHTNLNCTSEVYLRTLMARLVNPRTGKSRLTRLLMDCGSQRSYVLESTASQLKLDPKQSLKLNHTLFGGNKVVGHVHSVYEASLCGIDDNFSYPVTLMDHTRIVDAIPRIEAGPWLEELSGRGIVVNDQNASHSLEIEVLIGADYLGKLLTGHVVNLENGLTATETKLGWTVMGALEVEQWSSIYVATSTVAMAISSSTVSQLWSLDTLGIRDPIERKTQEEKEKDALDHFERTVTRNLEGRYRISLPWTNGSQVLPPNRAVAQKRLESATRKLLSSDKFEDYERVFREWEPEGIISVVSESDSENGKYHYLPHRPVFKDSITTPVRPVFDASCKTGRNPSLNDCLEKGPNLLEIIPSILLRFRMGRIGVIADVRKAFLMIEIDSEDRDFLRFLWWEDRDQHRVKVFRHNRVVFGMNCSPFLLGAVIFHHVNRFKEQFPSVVSLIQKGLYVDNLVTAVDNLSEFEMVKEKATAILSDAQMELRQWEKNGDSGGPVVTNVLGLKWDKTMDTLSCSPIRLEPQQKVTKRVLLSSLQKVFDPLGLWSPVLIVPKILLQRCWLENKDWEKEVGPEIGKEFSDWANELESSLCKVQLDRNCGLDKDCDPVACQLHVFGDASKKAFATVIFLRVETSEGVRLSFLGAKARVAPVKAASIPRLELLGCLISARLAASVKSAMGLKNVRTCYWTDSTTALAWVKRNGEWGTFVGNRTREICALTDIRDWRHVPGNMNPADLPSRGISPANFVASRWWEGPDWLKQDESRWPSSSPEIDKTKVNHEKKKTVVTMTTTVMPKPWYVVTSRYTSNLCVFAYVCRFIDSALKKQRRESKRVAPEELDAAELKLIKLIQVESFPQNRNVVEGLRVETDEQGLIRVKTKVTYRQDTELFRSPILLPHFHPLVDLIIMETHNTNAHGGAQLLMSQLREKFWIARGRSAINKIIRRCVKCRRFESRTTETAPCPLPKLRVSGVTAFETTGVDLAGPLILKNKSKAYVVIYTCAVFRCVHLEVTETLSTEDFLLSFTRFCMRRTRPKTVYSDNGTNFVGAVNLFETIDWDRVQKETQCHRVEWIFNPPSAPWWGGWWERLIRSVKDRLKRMIGAGKLNYVQLETALCEVESAMNNRPLTYVTEDQNDFVPLTPAMFLHNLPSSVVPEAELVKISDVGQKRKRLSQLLTELRERFRSDYLGQLVQRGKEVSSREFQLGEVVLIEVDNQKRVLWPMARIIELIKGKDGVIRVAKLQTSTSVLERPIQRLVPLEVRGDHPFITPTFEVNSAGLILKRKASKPWEQKKVVETMTRTGRTIKKPDRLCL